MIDCKGNELNAHFSIVFTMVKLLQESIHRMSKAGIR